MIYGRTELALREDFLDEFKSVKASLPAHFDIVYSSPASRCTALAEAIDQSFRTDDRLQELDFGDWEGKTWDTVDQDALRVWMDDYVHQWVPGGESMMAMHRRVTDFWEELTAFGSERVAIVTHAGVIRLILSMVRDIPLKDIFDIKVSYGEVVRVDT
nr:histidine phosphatase family protein [uncultured Dyadobacter sp.]